MNILNMKKPHKYSCYDFDYTYLNKKTIGLSVYDAFSTKLLR